MTTSTRQVGEAVAWVSEWTGIGGPARALHATRPEARRNAKWMGGVYTPLIPASDLDKVSRERDEAFAAGIRYAAEEMDALSDPSAENGKTKCRAHETYADAAAWLRGLDPKEVNAAARAFLNNMENRGG